MAKESLGTPVLAKQNACQG